MTIEELARASCCAGECRAATEGVECFARGEIARVKRLIPLIAAEMAGVARAYADDQDKTVRANAVANAILSHAEKAVSEGKN